MDKDWRTISRVVRVTVDGKFAEFNSLKEAVFGCRQSMIDSLCYGLCASMSPRLAVRTEIDYTVPLAERRRPYIATRGDETVFYDDLGLTIPVWKVKEAFYNIPIEEFEKRSKRNRHRFRWSRQHDHYDPKTDFRNGTVWGVGGHHYHSDSSANVRTRQEIRENDFALNFDEDCMEHGIKPRAARCKSYLPNAWDDRPCGSYRQTNWKHFRDHQWKGIA